MLVGVENLGDNNCIAFLCRHSSNTLSTPSCSANSGSPVVTILSVKC
jgi:hypothetical protein